VAALLAVVVSPVDEMTVAVLTIVPEVGVRGRRNVTVTETAAPGAREPIAQGNPPAHGADAETNESPDGAGSSIVTAAAAPRPVLVTVNSYVTVPPGTAVEGPALTIVRSASIATTVVTVAVLSATFASDALVAVTVATIGPGPG
jgi:hypothetical protein